MSQLECETCKITFKSKYNLKSHLVTNKKCLKIRGLELQSNFICKGCDASFVNKANMTIHMDICTKYIIMKKEELYTKNIEKIHLDYSEKLKQQEQQIMQQENTIKEIQKTLRQNTADRDSYIKLQVRYEDLEIQHEKTISKLELKIAQCDSFIQTLAREGSQKVTTTTNNTVHNNIRNHLSSTYTVDTLEPKQLEDTMRQYYTESDFFGGQKRLAGVCVEKVIKTPDGKMMICCSDIARKKFKILDVQGNLKEDIEARLLCQKLKVPIKMITKEIYDKVIDRIEKERERLSSDDRSRREKLLDDSMRAQQVYMDNLNFDDLNYNQDFMHELCVLLNV